MCICADIKFFLKISKIEKGEFLYFQDATQYFFSVYVSYKGSMLIGCCFIKPISKWRNNLLHELHLLSWLIHKRIVVGATHCKLYLPTNLWLKHSFRKIGRNFAFNEVVIIGIVNLQNRCTQLFHFH